jgi:hypothetical protein
VPITVVATHRLAAKAAGYAPRHPAISLEQQLRVTARSNDRQHACSAWSSANKFYKLITFASYARGIVHGNKHAWRGEMREGLGSRTYTYQQAVLMFDREEIRSVT